MKQFLALCICIFNFSFANEFLAIGEAVFDYSIFVDDKTLFTHVKEKGNWLPIDEATFNKIISEQKEKIKPSAAGSAVNTIKGLTILGKKCAIVGQIGKDKLGEEYVKAVQEKGITSYFYFPFNITARSICFVTPDGARTMRTCLGDYDINHDATLKEEMFKGIKWLIIEGYQLKNIQLIKDAITLAKKNNAQVSFNLSNTFLVNKYYEEIQSLLNSGSVDILIGNDEEMFALTKKAPQKALKELSKKARYCVATLGEKGAYTAEKGEVIFTPAKKVHTLDSTGAGDFFSSGFLFAVSENYNLKDASEIATIMASKIVQKIGTEAENSYWASVKQEFPKIYSCI